MDEIHYWTDHKGRKVAVHTMSDKWLNNIRKSCGKWRGNDKVDAVLNEIKRRQKMRKSRNQNNLKPNKS